MNQPQSLNAFSGRMGEELIYIFQQIEKYEEIKAVIVTGEGDKAFCAGMNLKAPRELGNQTSEDYRDLAGKVVLAILKCKKPIIAAINGSAVG